MKMKDVRPYSVWTHAYSKRYLTTHPWLWVKDVWYNCKAAYYRSKYGFAPRDVWEFGYAFLEVVPQMLKMLAENGDCYPGTEEFPTPESWKNHLLSISNLFENARDEVRDKKNEYYPAYEKTIWGRHDMSEEEKKKVSEITRKYLKRDSELAMEQEIMIEEAFKLLLRTSIKSLWD